MDHALTFSDEMVLADVIRAIGSPEFMDALMDFMRVQAGFRGAFVARLSRHAKPVHIYDNVRAERRSVVVDRWLDTAWMLDPYAVAFLNGQHAPVMNLPMVAPDRFKNSEYFETYYRSIRLRDELAVFVDIGEDVLFFSLGRLVGENRFSRRDIAKMEQAHPVIAALCAQHFFLQRGQAKNTGAGQTVEDILGDDLSSREIDVVNLILRGHSSRSVAKRLNLSVETVKVHRKNIYRKLGISTEAALFALFLKI